MNLSTALTVLAAVLLLGLGRSANAQPIVAGSAPLGDGSEGTLVIGGPNRQQVAQIFTAATSKRMTQVRLPVSCERDADLLIEIRLSRGIPGPEGPVVGTMVVPGASLPPLMGPELRILRLPQPIQLAEWGEYAIVLKSTGTCSILRGPSGAPRPEQDPLYLAALPDLAQWVCQRCTDSDLDFVPFLVIVEDLALPFGLRGGLADVDPKQWHALATPGQVVGVRPGVGGQYGRHRTITLLTHQLAAAAGGALGCPIPIGNVASLRAAAEARLLYLELERPGLPTIRGQLWPWPIGSPGIVVTAGASEQQVAGNGQPPRGWTRTTATLSVSERESFDVVGYTVQDRHRYRTAVLRCAPAGQNGDIVALLPAGAGIISKEDLLPVAATGSCGIAISDTGALLEALLRGNLYVSLELIEPAGVELRGQFPVP